MNEPYKASYTQAVNDKRMKVKGTASIGYQMRADCLSAHEGSVDAYRNGRVLQGGGW